MMSTESLVFATVGGAPMSSLKVGTDILIDQVEIGSLLSLCIWYDEPKKELQNGNPDIFILQGARPDAVLTAGYLANSCGVNVHWSCFGHPSLTKPNFCFLGASTKCGPGFGSCDKAGHKEGIGCQAESCTKDGLRKKVMKVKRNSRRCETVYTKQRLWQGGGMLQYQ